MQKYFIVLISFLLLSFSDVSLKKRIADAHYRYEFYTTNKVVSAKPERSYYWFKGGAIHNSEQGMAGELLHNDFLKFYHSNQLAEAGEYKNGLKEGYWKTWFENGILQSETYWNKGQKDGSYAAYDVTGLLTQAGKYRNNKKHGKWINYIAHDTLKYNNDKVLLNTKKIKKDSTVTTIKRDNFIKRLFSKKGRSVKVGTTGGDDKKQKSPKQKNKMPKDKANSNSELKNTDDVNAGAKDNPGFFERLFSKKNKTNRDGKSS